MIIPEKGRVPSCPETTHGHFGSSQIGGCCHIQMGRKDQWTKTFSSQRTKHLTNSLNLGPISVWPLLGSKDDLHGPISTGLSRRFLLRRSPLMITRRRFLGTSFSGLAAVAVTSVHTSGKTFDEFYQLTFPPFDALDNPIAFGFGKPSEAQKDKAKEIIASTPTGKPAIEIAESFIDRYSKSDPELIAQWPAPSAWNPLVVDFFSATSLKANNDMIAWC